MAIYIVLKKVDFFASKTTTPIV